MDIAIVMFVLIVTLSRPGNSLPAFNDVESVTEYSNANTPVDTKGFEKNIKKAKKPLMQLISMGNIEEVEKFGKREIEQSNTLPSLNRKARCKYSRISLRSRKAKKLGGVSTTPVKHISIMGSNSANRQVENHLRKSDIRAPSVTRAGDQTNNLDNAKTMKRENEHRVEEIVVLPPQTIDPVVVISEGPTPISQPTKIGRPLNAARGTDNPHYERNDKWSSQEIFRNFPLNDKQMTPDTRQPFGINQNAPFGNLAPEISRKHISNPSYAGKSNDQNTLVGNAMIRNNRNLGEPFGDDEDSFSDEHDVIKPPPNNLELDDCIKNFEKTSFHSINGNPLTEQLNNDPNVPVPGKVHGQNVDSASIYEDTDKIKKDRDSSSELKENQATTSVTGATEAPEIDRTAHPAMGLSGNEMVHEQKSSSSEESSTKPYNHVGKQNAVIGSGGSPEDELKRTSTTSILNSLQDKTSSTMPTTPEDLKSNDLRDSAADILKEKTDEIALVRRLLLIPEVQHLALQDSLSTVIEADFQPVAQLAGRTAGDDQQTLPDENLEQYIKNVLHYSGLTAEGIQSEVTKNILFRTIKHTLQNAGFKVDNAHIWDTLKTVISQTRLPRPNPISDFSNEKRTSKIRSAHMRKVDFKRLPFTAAKERVFKDGGWVDKSTLLGSSSDRFEPKLKKAQSKKLNSKFTTERMEQALLADSGKASFDQLKAIDVAEQAVQKPSPVMGEFVSNGKENEKTPIKYYSPAGRLLAYRKKIQVPKVMFRLEEKPKVSPRAPRLSPVADSSFPATSEPHSLPLATENMLKITEDWKKSTPPVLAYTKSPPSEKFREKPGSSGNHSDLHQMSQSSLKAAKNSKGGTPYQQIPDKQIIVPQDQVSNHEQSSLIDGSPFATPEYDLMHIGKISFTSAKSAPAKMPDLTDTDLFYIGDGVKIPLKLKRISDGSWGLSISEDIFESFVKQKCPCYVPNEKDIIQEKRRQKKNTSFTEKTGPSPTPQNHFLLDRNKSSISDDEPKERGTRCFLESDPRTTSSSPVTKFVEKYNLSRTENRKRTINDISPKSEPQFDYDGDVTESSKNLNSAEGQNWTADRETTETINGVAVVGNNNDKVNNSPKNKDYVMRNPIDRSMNSTNVRDLRSKMEYQANFIEPNVLNFYNVPEREDSNITENSTTNEMNSHLAENLSRPMSSRSPGQRKPSKIDSVLEAGDDEVIDRWSWIRDLVDSQRKRNVVMNSQDMDEAILRKIDDMFESRNTKVTKNPTDGFFTHPVKNLKPMLGNGKICERKFRKIKDSRQINHSGFGVNSIDSSKEYWLVRSSRPEAKHQNTDEPNRKTLIDKKKLKGHDDYNLARISNVQAKSNYRRDDPILKRIRNVNKKRTNARPYRYQQYIDNEAQERMDVLTGVLYWLKEVFFEPSAESDD